MKLLLSLLAITANSRELTSWLPEFKLTVSHTTHLSYRIQMNDIYIYIVSSTWKIFPFFHQKKNITTTKSDPTLPQPTFLKGAVFQVI